MADLQSKLASLQLAVQSTQPGTKLHQVNYNELCFHEQLLVSVWSAALPSTLLALDGLHKITAIRALYTSVVWQPFTINFQKL